MTAVIMGCNPDKWNWDGAYSTAVADVQNAGRHLRRWPLDRVLNLPAGTEAWLLVQGGRPNQRGLIGHGITVGEPYTDEHYDPDTGGALMYVTIEFDLLLPEGEQLRTDELVDRVPSVDWKAMPGSGRRLPPEAESAVRKAWAEFLRDTGSGERVDLAIIPGTQPEWALARVSVNRYERDPEAGRQAIALHGSHCHVCGFDFEATYGPEGAGFIHVHHTVPVSRLGQDYEIDPRTDLVPLCPNCHYMAHRRSDPYTVAELRAMVAHAGHLPGAVVTEEQLAAQEDARQISSKWTG